MDAPSEPAERPHWSEPLRLRPWPVVITVVVVCGLVSWRIGVRPDLPAFLYLGVVGSVLAFVDAALKRLPDPLTLPSYLVGAGSLGVAAVFTSSGWERFAHGLVGLAVLLVLYFLQAFLAPGQIGLGDVKLAGVLGLYLGWLGVAPLVVGVAAMHLTSGLYALGLLAARQATLKSTIPFGPFMLLGALIGVLVHP